MAGAAIVMTAVLVAGLAASAVAERANVMGNSKRTPKPNCPNSCEVNGQVTGFQRSIDGQRGLFRAKKNGRIVAWGVDLSKPNKEQRDFFEELARTDSFGGKPTAGISILARAGKGRYRLVRNSPIVALNNYYRESPIISLRDPLRIKKGQIVALTTATWLPNFASDTDNRNMSGKNRWLASRTHKHFPRPSGAGYKKACAVPPNVPPSQQPEYFFDNSSPHRKVGSKRKYGCEYRKARLMYYAYFVPRG